MAIEKLGHSAGAYRIALDRLERKFGGQRRQIAMCMEDVANFQPIRNESAREVDEFADLLELAVVNLTEFGRGSELQCGAFYTMLQKKMTEPMLCRYHRWVYENQKSESVFSLREWLTQEAEFKVIASETVHGIHTQSTDTERVTTTGKSFFASKQSDNRCRESDVLERHCKVCGEKHEIEKCYVYEARTVSKRWELARSLQLCFRCLRENHLGRQCPNTRMCNVNGCTENHHWLLH